MTNTFFINKGDSGKPWRLKVKSFEKYLKETQPEPLVPSDIREEYISEQYESLMEALITFGGQAYPKFGNIVIMAGGAGSGKGFVKDNLVGLEGKVFDVDALKTMASKTPAIAKKIKAELGIDLYDIALKKDALKNPDNVAKLHEIIGEYLGLDAKQLKAFYISVMTANPDRKPNIIFDVTLKDLRKLEKITRQTKALGYNDKNIHIVWVVNDIEVAKAQNATRDRTVPAEILVNTHRGASQTMLDVINMGKSLKKYMDGDIVFAFNKFKVDAAIAKSDKSGKKIGMAGDTKGGQYIEKSNYFYVKRSGKPVTPQNKLEKSLKAKIASYVPKNVDWV